MPPDRIIRPRRPDKPYQSDPWANPIRISGNGEPPSIDEQPPIGFEGPLLKEPPKQKTTTEVYIRGNYNADLTAPED